MKKFISAFAAVLWSAGLNAATITVNSTADNQANDGSCTLREAIVAANTNAASGAMAGECAAGEAADIIAFSIGSGLQTIAPGSTLPSVTANDVTIDGTTQPGFSGSPLIELNGTGAVAPNDWGIRFDGSGDAVRGLVINRFPGSGLVLSGSASAGIIEGNFIGTDPSGTTDLGNGVHGISCGGDGFRIGGQSAAAANLISGNTGCGIHLVGNESDNNQVEGNFIGTNLSGTAALGNDFCGIVINNGADANQIGGADPAQRNLISGNGGNGVMIGGGVADTDGNVVKGNFIGTDASGAVAIANVGLGVLVEDTAAGTQIGGEAAGEGNVIAFNQDVGVGVRDATATGRILGNSIHSNSGLGIDLDLDGVTANDASDSDVGPNNFQNFPVLSSASSDGANFTIEGTLQSQTGGQYRIEFFANDACDASSNGEGQTFLGSIDVTADGGGNAAIAATLAVAGGNFLTSTATDAATGDTSEFSACIEVTAAATPSPTPVATPTATPSPSASPDASPEIACGDGVDNDGDGFSDCADPDCDATIFCTSAGLSGGGCNLAPSSDRPDIAGFGILGLGALAFAGWRRRAQD